MYIPCHKIELSIEFQTNWKKENSEMPMNSEIIIYQNQNNKLEYKFNMKNSLKDHQNKMENKTLH